MAELTPQQELLQQQIEAAGKFRVKAVKPSVSIESDYNVKLQRIVREIRKDINDNLVPVLRATASEYRRDSYVGDITGVFRWLQVKWVNSQQARNLSSSIAEWFVRTSEKNNADRSRRSFGVDIFQNNQELNDYLTASIYDNSRLITSIPEQYLSRVESIVMTNVRAGLRPKVIEQQLVKEFGVTVTRARLIARDQTAKVNSNLSEKRQRSAGYEYFQWIDSDDQRVRTRHSEIANKMTKYGKGIYRWDDLPLSDTGQPISPGTDYQCRCVARPVSREEVEENIRLGKVGS